MQFLSTIWIFIQDQILGMKWLSSLIGEFLYSIGLDTSGKIGGSVQFFIYDVIKIVFLLCMLIFIISYIQSFFPPERTKRILGTFHGIGANILAALLGTVTPFCSCSSIPLSMIMLKKAIKPKLLDLFIGICTVGIIIVGYAFNAFQYLLI